MDRLWRSNSSISSRTSCPPDIVNDEDHNVEKHGASALMCLHDTKSKNFKDNIFCINLRNSPISKIRDLIILNIVIFFIYNLRKTTSPGTDRRVRSPQSIHTILVLALNYHVFLTTVAFRNTYSNQPYTSHALHALSWLKRALQFGSRNSLYD